MNKTRILIVEDEAIVALDIRRQLADLGYEPVAHTMQGEDAVTLAGNLRPDLVLMDIQLAGETDGIATAQEIRQRFSIPVVFLTAFAGEETLKRAKLAEPYGYIIKPFEDRDLRTVIEMAIYKHQAERDLKEGHAALTAIVQGAMDGFYFIDGQGRFLDVNEAYCQMTGYSREELLRMSISDLAVDETQEQILADIANRLQNGFKRFERRQRCKDGRLADIEVSPGFIPGDKPRLFGFARDITDRKRAEEEREATLKLLNLVNSENDLHGLMEAATILLRDWSGCTAVGIRLKEDKDYPYFETRGFPPEFVAAENKLCRYDASGNPVCDDLGNPALDCMCGNVLCGRFDSALPFFTEHGSFWTNSTTALLATTPQEDLQSSTRNRCNGEGYESVALIPLRVGAVTLGLLQMNDSRKDRFTPYTIGLLERMSNSLAVAVAHRQAQEKVLESATKFRSYIQNAPIGIAVADREGRYVEVNPAVADMLGYSEEEFLKLRVHDVLAPSKVAEGLSLFRKLVEENAASGEKLLLRKDGTEFWAMVSSVRLNDNRFMAFHQDISARKNAEQEALSAASLLEAAFESTADALLMSNRDGLMTHYNHNFVELWNLPKEVLASGDEKLAIEAVLEKVREPIGFKKRILYLYEHPEEDAFDMVELKNGRILERYSKSYRVGGRVVGRVWSFRDVTNRKRLEDQLRQAQKMEAVGQLAGGVAHDFNNILAVILMHLGLLQEESALSEAVRGSLRDLTTEAQRAAALTRQLLAFSRRQIIQIKPVDLDVLVENLLKMLRRLLGEHITLDWQCESGLPLLNADPGMVEQIVMNLSVNARDAMPGGGSITIRAKPVRIEENGAGNHPESRAGNFVRLDVMDTGCGMDEGVLKHIFEPFFTTKEVGRGTGLGLSTVYGIVKQHGGWMEVESVVGKGSSFHVFLPVCASVRPGENNNKSTPVVGGRGETILVVEDETAVQQLVRRTLERNGYRVLQASSGPEALGLWRQYRADIDLLFSDVVMPHGMTGYQLADSLRKDKPGLKVILSTGYSDKLIEFGRQGIQTFFVLAKPYTSSALLAAIRNTLDKGSAIDKT